MTVSLVTDLKSSPSERRVYTKLVLTRASFPKENLAEVGFIRPSLSFPFLLKEKRRRKRKKPSEAAGCFEIYKEGKNGQTKVCLEGSFTLSESGMPSLNKKGRKAKE